MKPHITYRGDGIWLCGGRRSGVLAFGRSPSDAYRSWIMPLPIYAGYVTWIDSEYDDLLGDVFRPKRPDGGEVDFRFVAPT